ncbi:predicted protein [Naegleria gruberi]|uniref:Predicted protein n=1 Tax=Naegleria gruberi TaxID=5762 RepID=D2V204_NAEGR|nr:uncharacterized protein NAEGRDRAFT_62757 [Naegleria gruberi]EFC49402.1 predicted protein [Naegleria gruberi]|eukprot:XP_002682146.1 predicted protein [Naegleria gruberi strain NEG-M]
MRRISSLVYSSLRSSSSASTTLRKINLLGSNYKSMLISGGSMMLNTNQRGNFVSSLFKRTTTSEATSSENSTDEANSSTTENQSIILYNSKYNNLVHRFIIQPYQINKTHILNALATTGMLYTIYELDINVNWFICCLWLMGSSYLSYSSHVNNINHKICVLTKLEYDSKNKVLYLFDDSGNVVDTITDFRNLILDNELGFKVHMPLAGFFWKSFLLNRTDMADRFTLKFLNYNSNEVKARVKYQDFGLLRTASERMKRDAVTTIDPETGVMKQYVYMIANSNPQVIKELREDLLDLKQQHGVKPKF